MINIATTKLYKNNQTAIPSEIRKEFNLKPDVLIDWNKDEKGVIYIEFREKELTFDDFSDAITNTNLNMCPQDIEHLFKGGNMSGG